MKTKATIGEEANLTEAVNQSGATHEAAPNFQAMLELALKHHEQILNIAQNLPDVPVGQSPKELIWTRNKARLYHYLPTTSNTKRHSVPLLLIYSLINKPYILDLRPGASLVEYLLGQGYEVYLLDWGTPGPEDRHLKLDDYVLDYLPRAIKHVLRHAKTTEITLFGYCLGALLTLCATALHPALPIKNLVLIAAPVDFSEKGLLQSWLNPEHFEIDRVVEVYGLIPAEVVDFGTKMLKPFNNFVLTYTNLLDKLCDERAVEGWVSMQRWVNDGVPFAGEAFRQWVKDFYLGNKLVTGQLTMRGQLVELCKVKANLLNVIAENDHITPPSQSLPLLNLVSSPDKTQLVLPGGHVGLVVGRSAANNFWPVLDNWLNQRSDS